MKADQESGNKLKTHTYIYSGCNDIFRMKAKYENDRVRVPSLLLTQPNNDYRIHRGDL